MAAIGAFELAGEFAMEGQAAAFAEGRFDEADLLPALETDVAFSATGASGAANLADVGINESQRSFRNGL